MKRLLLTALLFVPSLASAGPVYVYRDSSGVTHITSHKPPKGVRYAIPSGTSKVSVGKGNFSRYKGIPHSYRSYQSSKLYLNRYSDIITQASRTYGVSAGLVRAVIHAESAFNPRAVSRKGAQGLMQLLPENCRLYKVKDPFDPKQNINGGVKMLSDLHKRYNGNLALTLAAYNAGAGAVDKYKGIPPFSETRQYVQRVIALRQRYLSVS